MITHNVYQFDSGGTAVGELVPVAGGGLNFPSDIVIDPDGNLLVSNMGDDKADPPISGYIGKYNLTTGAAINSSFITFSGSTLVQPTAMLIEPYGVWTGGAAGTAGRARRIGAARPRSIRPPYASAQSQPVGMSPTTTTLTQARSSTGSPSPPAHRSTRSKAMPSN